MKLSENAIKVLNKRYLKRDEHGTVIEAPEDMFRRVADTIAQADAVYKATPEQVEQTSNEFYDMMTNLEFLPNSPTLMNAGRDLGMLSACFVIGIDDNMDSIFDAVKYTAKIQQAGGGTGFSFSRLRPKNDLVKTTMGVSSGPVSFMQVFNETTETIKQGGTRRGASIAVLRVDHPDVLDFITCKEQSNKLNNFNISVAITDAFMDAFKQNTTYALINPRTKQEVGRLNATDVFNLLVVHAWENGDPGIVFIDEINRYNPLPSVDIESTNPCGEQPLLAFESCNLGSINLSKFCNCEVIDWSRLKEVVHSAVHFLDNVIDVNKFPLPQIETTTKLNRKIGLGVMGWADMLIQCGIAYDSYQGVEFGGQIMKFITEEGMLASQALAEKRGTFPNHHKSIYKHAMRNATITTIAPTGTLSIIAGCSSGIEPLFALAFKRRQADQEMQDCNADFLKAINHQNTIDEQLLKTGSCQHMNIPDEIKRVYVVSHDISYDWHVRMQASFQRETHNAVSKTINFPKSATVEDVKNAYLLSYRLFCKGITIYRDGSREQQVLSTGQTASKDTAIPVNVTITRTRPTVTTGKTHKIQTGCGSLYVTVNSDSQGVCEVFTVKGKSGGCAAAQSEAISRLISLSLKSGIQMPDIVKQIKNIRCPSPILASGGSILSCPDAISKILAQYSETLTPAEAQESTGQCPECPDCGGLLEISEGCAHCICGFSKCG